MQSPGSGRKLRCLHLNVLCAQRRLVAAEGAASSPFVCSERSGEIETQIVLENQLYLLTSLLLYFKHIELNYNSFLYFILLLQINILLTVI